MHGLFHHAHLLRHHKLVKVQPLILVQITVPQEIEQVRPFFDFIKHTAAVKCDALLMGEHLFDRDVAISIRVDLFKDLLHLLCVFVGRTVMIRKVLWRKDVCRT